MSPWLGRVVLAASGAGFPLTQAAIRRFGAPGALAVEGISGGLLVRDAALLAAGAPRRLRRGPAILLGLETAVALAAVVAGLRPLLDTAARQHASEPHPGRAETIRRVTIGTLFGLHTLRFRIYLQPDHGLRRPA